MAVLLCICEQFTVKYIPKSDERRARDYHRADDEAEEQLAARETESREAEGQRRGDEGRDEHGEYRDRRAV